jgi:hypothetical protein
MYKQIIHTTLLLLVIVLDSLFTILIGIERSPIYLWLMEITELSLVDLMNYRILVLLPFALFVGVMGKAGITVVLYIMLYVLLTLVHYFNYYVYGSLLQWLFY